MRALRKPPQEHTDRVQDSDDYPRMGELSEFARANPGIDSLPANHGSREFLPLLMLLHARRSGFLSRFGLGEAAGVEGLQRLC
jgi:hypothetical protein